MVLKTFITLIIGTFISTCIFGQDTSSNQKLSENETYHVAPSDNQILTPHIYRDTRLGSSSPMYNTYKKNDYGAGSVTTDPHKASGSTFTPNFNITPTQKSPIYRDTRLGSSSPLYNTYQKNDYGAGAITTNPNKGGGGSFTPTTTQLNSFPEDTINENSRGYNDTLNNNNAGTVRTNPNKK